MLQACEAPCHMNATWVDGTDYHTELACCILAAQSMPQIEVKQLCEAMCQQACRLLCLPGVLVRQRKGGQASAASEGNEHNVRVQQCSAW